MKEEFGRLGLFYIELSVSVFMADKNISVIEKHFISISNAHTNIGSKMRIVDIQKKSCGFTVFDS